MDPVTQPTAGRRRARPRGAGGGRRRAAAGVAVRELTDLAELEAVVRLFADDLGPRPPTRR